MGRLRPYVNGGIGDHCETNTKLVCCGLAESGEVVIRADVVAFILNTFIEEYDKHVKEQSGRLSSEETSLSNESYHLRQY